MQGRHHHVRYATQQLRQVVALGAGHRRRRVQDGTMTGPNKARQTRRQRCGHIRLADGIEDQIVGWQLGVFQVGGVVDHVLDAGAGIARQQDLHRHIAPGPAHA